MTRINLFTPKIIREQFQVMPGWVMAEQTFYNRPAMGQQRGYPPAYEVFKVARRSKVKVGDIVYAKFAHPVGHGTPDAFVFIEIDKIIAYGRK